MPALAARCLLRPEAEVRVLHGPELDEEQVSLDCPVEQDLQIKEFAESAERSVSVNHVKDCRNASSAVAVLPQRMRPSPFLMMYL
jgi:hypothetical protein